MGLRKFIVAAALAAYISLASGCVNLRKPYGSIESDIGHDSAVAEIDVGCEIAPRVGIYSDTRISADYETTDEDISAISILDGTVNLIDGLDALVEARAETDAGVSARAGFQYFRKWGEFSIYASATVKTMKDPDGEVIIKATYAPQLNEDIGLYFSAKNVSGFAKEHKYSIQRLRAAIDIHGIKIGPMGDLIQTGNAGHFDYNIGGFARIDF